MDYESFNFGAIDPDESMRVDFDDYSAIMIQKKSSMDSWKQSASAAAGNSNRQSAAAAAVGNQPSSMLTPGGGVTPGGDESNEPRDLEQEAEFLVSIFVNFDRKVIDQVLKQFPSLDSAYIHLQEFLDLELDSDDENMEESKGGHAASNLRD